MSNLDGRKRRLATVAPNPGASVMVLGISGRGREIVEWLSMNLSRLESCTVLVESDDFLFRRSLTLDVGNPSGRKSFQSLLHEKSRTIDALDRLKSAQTVVQIHTCHLDIHSLVISVDADIYETSLLEAQPDLVTQLEEGTQTYLNTSWMIEQFSSDGAFTKYLSKGKEGQVETIEAFDETHVRRAIFPRESFYNSDLIKLVVWVYIFDRTGRVLIHRRASNAKDNRGMWDKSVGGHADYRLDSDTTKTVAREVVEELFTDEKSTVRFLRVNDEDIIFLGEWRPEKRYDFPFLEVKENPEKWYFFKDPERYRTQSNRHLPDGRMLRNEVIADVYYMIVSEDIDEKSLGGFKNSSYQLYTPTDLKNLHDSGEEGDQQFKFSPDLSFAMTSRIRHRLEEMQNYIQYNLYPHG